MKNDMKKKVMAGSMALVMAAGLAGTYGYQQSVPEVKAEDKDVEALEEAATKALGDSTEENTGEAFKEESVYVKADPSGKVTSTTVTEWLKNPGSGTFADVTGLDDVRNIKGDEEFTKGSGEEVNWKSEGDDIYYQGTTDQELPVDVKVSYKLDGKDISAEDLEGKDGKVEIHIDYDNKSKETVDVNGEQVEMYTPFTMVTAMMLSADEYSNITIDHGKIMSDADKNIVVGLGFPGLSENLNLDDADLDIDIPDSVTITADVKDASVGPTITVASSEIMDEFDLSDVNDFDSLEDSIGQLEDAADQLVDGSKEAADGSKELADGSKTLADGSKELASGSKTLADGSKELSDGVNTLNDKSGELISGVNTLADGIGTYTNGVTGLYQGSVSIAEGAAQLQAGAKSLNEGVQQAAAGANNLTVGAQSVKEGMASVGNNLGTVSAALGNVTAESVMAGVDVTISNEKATLTEEQISAIVEANFANADDATKAQVRTAINAALEQSTVSADTAKSLNATGKTVVGTVGQAKKGVDDIQTAVNSQLVPGIASIQTGAGQLAGMLGQGDGQVQTIGSGAATLEAGTKSLAEGTQTLSAGAKQLRDNSAPLIAGMEALKQGGSQLASGVGQLANGAGQVSDGASALADGSQQLADGSQQLADGSQQLADGNQQLADGMSEFKTEGIDKLTEVFDGDIQNVTSRIDAMSTLGKNYKSFAGIKDGMNGSTKFIIETVGVEEK